MGAIASQITSLTIVYSIVYSDADQRKHQSSASLALVRGIHRGPVNSPHKWPVTRKMFPFDDVIMEIQRQLPEGYFTRGTSPIIYWNKPERQLSKSLFKPPKANHDDVIKIETLSAFLTLCDGNPPVTGGFPSQRPVTRNFGVFFDLPEQTVNQTIETRVIWVAIALRTSLCHCNVWVKQLNWEHGIQYLNSWSVIITWIPSVDYAKWSMSESHPGRVRLNQRSTTIFLYLTPWILNKMAAIFHPTFSNAFSWMRMYELRLKFHWSLFLGVELIIFTHWFR